MAKALTGLTSATYTDGSGNTQTVTGGSSTISDAAGNSTVVSKGGVTTTDGTKYNYCCSIWCHCYRWY